jgi:hypothetical protein
MRMPISRSGCLEKIVPIVRPRSARIEVCDDFAYAATLPGQRDVNDLDGRSTPAAFTSLTS